ncbi:MAG: hypothetical protein AB7Q23_04290 [Hyphomonadaceae bacterium]
MMPAFSIFSIGVAAGCGEHAPSRAALTKFDTSGPQGMDAGPLRAYIGAIDPRRVTL